MAGPLFADRVKETSTTTGTGTVSLLGTSTGFRTFVAGIGDTNSCWYAIVHQTLDEWEVGIGTVTDAATDTLSRTTVLASSTGSAINFSAGTKDVFVTIPGGLLAQALTWTGVATMNPAARSSGVAPYWRVITPVDTAQTLSTESIGIAFGGTSANPPVSVTRQYATGALALHREYLFTAPTLAAVGASTITTAVTAEFASPKTGTNATLTASIAGRFIASEAAHVPLVAKGAGSQSGDLFETQNSSGTVLSYFDSTANLIMQAHIRLRQTSQFDIGSNAIGSNSNSVIKTNDGTTLSVSLSEVNRSLIIADSADVNVAWGHGVQSNPTLYIQSADGATAAKFMSLVHDGTNGIIAVGTGAVVIKGIASRTAALTNFQTSAAGSLGNVSGGCVGDVFADVSTTHTDGTFDTLRTDTLVANALIVNGDKIYFDYTLTVVTHTTNTADFKLVFAGVTIFDSGALTFAATGTVRITGYIIRKTSTTCRAHVTFSPSGSATILGFASENYVADGTLTGLTLSNSNTLVLSAAAAGTGAASGDVALVMGTVHIDGFGS